MNQGIPKAARDALARQTPADQHPSADLLNGYVEQSLTASEKDRVATHLAACADCREVVFLATGAVEEPATAEAAAAPAAFHAAMPMYSPVAKPPSRRSRTGKWVGWKWALPAVAVLAIVSGIVLRVTVFHDQVRYDTASVSKPPAVSQPGLNQQTPNQQRPNLPTPNVPLTASPGDNSQLALSAPSKPAPAADTDLKAREAESVPSLSHARGSMAANRNAAAGTARGATVPVDASRAGAPAGMMGGTVQGGTVGGVLGSVMSTTPKTQAASATPPIQLSQSAEGTQAAPGSTSTEIHEAVVRPEQSENQSRVEAQSSYAESSKAGAMSPRAFKTAPRVRAIFQITSDGHVERELPGGAWTRMLAEQPAVFRVVSITGGNVWAGGNSGALFRSVDRGEHWTPVALTANGQTESGTIVSIHFDTPLQGTIGTEEGATWHTSDGGLTWTK